MLSRYRALTLSACHTFALKINFALSPFQLLCYEDLQRGKLIYRSSSIISSEGLSLFFISKSPFSSLYVLGRQRCRPQSVARVSFVSVEQSGRVALCCAATGSPQRRTAVLHCCQGTRLHRSILGVFCFFCYWPILSPLQVCLQTFQLLSSEVAPLVWDKENSSPVVQAILQALMDLILGQVSNEILPYQFNLNHLKKKKKTRSVLLLRCATSQWVLFCSAATGTRVFWQALLCPCWSTRHQRAALEELLPGACCRSLTPVGNHKWQGPSQILDLTSGCWCDTPDGMFPESVRLILKTQFGKEPVWKRETPIQK